MAPTIEGEALLPHKAEIIQTTHGQLWPIHGPFERENQFNCLD